MPPQREDSPEGIEQDQIAYYVHCKRGDLVSVAKRVNKQTNFRARTTVGLTRFVVTGPADYVELASVDGVTGVTPNHEDVERYIGP